MYLQPETIHLRDWMCENSQCVLSRASDRSPIKVPSITTPPRVLIVQLVRWKNVGHRRTCLFHAVIPDMVLAVSGVQYDLKAIVCHLGHDASHGHYTARIHFPAEGGNWWYYNNTTRRLAEEEELETTATERSYLLMYEQRLATVVLEKKNSPKAGSSSDACELSSEAACSSTDAASRPETSMPASSSVNAVPGVSVTTPCISTKPTPGLRLVRLPPGRPRVVTKPSSERVGANQTDQGPHMSD